ncbi:MAG: helix-turn-helix transcriptional regulator [Candidatus Humimicrobiaceae bacterium]
MTKLEKILKERGIKQVWLAEKINKSPAELNRWLKGKRIPAYENMCKISKALNIPVEDIFFNDKVVVSANESYISDNTCINNNKQPEKIKAKDLQMEEKEYINKP